MSCPYCISICEEFAGAHTNNDNNSLFLPVLPAEVFLHVSVNLVIFMHYRTPVNLLLLIECVLPGHVNSTFIVVVE